MLSFQILGPLEVLRDRTPLPLGAAKQRALLAHLLLSEGEVVSTGRLIDGLWGEEPPATTEHLLHVYVSRLRKLLEDDGRKLLLTRPPGYVLRLGEGDELDAATFEVLLREARSSGRSPTDALALLERALGLWRGQVLADLADEPFVVAATGRLDELRAVAGEERVEALLALGRHEEAVPELETLVTRYPLRERLRAQQMLALYRSGRQADALGAFGSARRLLAEELGVDPGPVLRSLEQDILRHAPELEAPSRAAVTAPTPSGPGERIRTGLDAPATAEILPQARRRGRGRAWMLLASLGAAGVVAFVAFVVAPGPSRLAPDRESLLLEWFEVPSAEAFRGPGDQIVLGGADTSFGYLALGYSAAVRASGVPNRDYDAVVWTATTPDDWTRQDPAVFAGPGNQSAADAAVLGDLLVVVGRDGSRGDFDAAAWVSTDGSSWTRVGQESPAFRQPGDQAMRDVALVGDRLVAIGYAVTGDGDDAAAWSSPDGRSWVLLTGGVLGGPDDQQMATVTSYAGGVLAAGFSAGEEDRDAAAWTSEDGLIWGLVPAAAFGGPGDQQINAIAAGCGGLIAVGEETADGETDAAVWRSLTPAGVRWERVDDLGRLLGGPGPQRMFAVACSPMGWVAAGADGVGSETDGAVWTSVDGLVWVRLSEDTPGMSALTDDGRESVRVLLPLPDGFIAFGAEGHGVDNNADAWIGRLAT